MRLVHKATANTGGSYTFDIKTPISKLYFDLDLELVSESEFTPEVMLRSPERFPYITIVHYSKKSTENVLANKIPFGVLASFSQYQEGALTMKIDEPDTDTSNPFNEPLTRCSFVVDLTPNQSEYPEAASLIFDNDEYIQIIIDNLDEDIYMDVYGKQTDYRTFLALKYNTVSIGNGDSEDSRNISESTALILPAASYTGEGYSLADVTDLEHFGDGNSLTNVRIKNDSGYDQTFYPAELETHSYDTNDVAAHVLGIVGSHRQSTSIPGYLTHHVLPVQNASELFINTNGESMKYYTVNSEPVGNIMTMENVKVSNDLSVDILADKSVAAMDANE